MTENTPGKKAAISQFQIKNVTDITTDPVTPVKIAPPPVTVKRAKSLKSDRTKFKRYVSVPHKNRDTFTLPRQVTDPNIKPKADNKKQEPESIEHNNNNKTSENGAETRVEQEGAVTETKETKPSNGISKMPETASWQNVVNTHRRGSSMTFVSTQNWAQFDVAPVKEKEPEFDWNITVDQWSSYEEAFHGIKPLHGFISGKQSREYLVNTGLPRESLAKIWDLADMDHDGSLSLAEFAVAMHCISCISAVSSVQLPVHVPHKLRDSLLFHVSNNLLSSINKENNKSPEKSSLKSSGSTSKGANVTFREENSTCDTLPRQRPRPSKKLVTTTPLHLKPQPVLSSSSYYSSDNSEEESEPVSRKLDLSDMSEKKKHDKKERREKKKKHKSKSSESESKNDVDHSPNQEQAPSDTKLPIRRERTYEEVGDFITKLEIQEGDDDVEALLQSSEDEDKVPAPPPPALSPSTKTRRPSRPDMGPPRRRPSSAAPTGPPPCSPPPSSPPTSSPPPSSLILVEEKEEAEEKGEKGEEEIKEEAKENIEGAKEIKEKEVKAVKEEIEETKKEVEETKEEVEETKEEVEETKEEVEETKEEDEETEEEVEETKEEDEETEEEEQGSPTEVTTTSAEDGEVTSGSERSVNHDPSGYERLADELPEAELMVAPTIVLNEGEMIDSDSEDDNDVTPRVDDVTPNLVTSQEDTTEKNVAEALDGHTDLPILRLEQPAMARGHRSGSVDSAMLTYCSDKDGFRLPDFKSLHEETCQNKLQLEDLEADEEELKAEKDMWNLDDVAHTEPDFEQLKETDLADLRTMIRDYELHNSALFSLARELRIELLRVQEQKHHLKSTLKCMKKD